MTAQITRTRMDVIVGALAKLGVAISNQPPDLEDVQYVDAEIESICRLLEATEVAYIPDRGQPGPMGGNIPAAYYDPLTSIVADLVSPKFGLSPDDTMKLKRLGLGDPPGTGNAAMQFHKILRGRPTFEQLRVDYY